MDMKITAEDRASPQDTCPRKIIKTDFVIYGPPATKKNSSQIIYNKALGRAMLIPSKQYKKYEAGALQQIDAAGLTDAQISTPSWIKCVYYMPTRRKVDLTNLLSATMDILVRAGVLVDDSRDYAWSNDGSRVLWDKERPRVEISIRPAEDFIPWK